MKNSPIKDTFLVVLYSILTSNLFFQCALLEVSVLALQVDYWCTYYGGGQDIDMLCCTFVAYPLAFL